MHMTLASLVRRPWHAAAQEMQHSTAQHCTAQVSVSSAADARQAFGW